MKLWIAELHDSNKVTESFMLFCNVNKESLLTEIRNITKVAGNRTCIFYWEIWQIDPKLDFEFLTSMISHHFDFHSIPRVEKSTEFFNLRNGKKIIVVAGKKKDPYPSSWI